MSGWEKGLTPSQIGVILRHSHRIAQVNSVTRSHPSENHIRRHPVSEICNHISGSNHPSENHIRRHSSSECCTTKSEIFIGGDSRIGQRSSSDDGDFVGLAKIGSEQFEEVMDDWGRRAVFRSNSI
ncbi:hypothetical protein LXL04_003808 [Taraxacum kok-saghyz]